MRFPYEYVHNYFHIHESELPPIIHVDNSIIEAAWRLFTTNSLGLPVCNHDNELKGFISISDIAQWWRPGELSHNKIIDDEIAKISQISVEQAMSRYTVTIDIEAEFKVVVDLLLQRHLIYSKHLQDRKSHISNIPVLENNRLVGVLNYLHILKEVIVEGIRVSDVYRETLIPTISPKHTLETAYHHLISTGERSLLVINQRDVPIGVISDTQILKYMSKDNNLSKLPVSMVMTDLTLLTTISPKDDLEIAIRLFSNRDLAIRAYPVVENNKLAGVISYLDILRNITEFG